MADERITGMPVAAAASGSDAGWHVIHAGKEFSPMSLAELVEKAVAGEIEADDLVKKTGGLWTKASDFDFLRQQFLLRDSRQEALDKLDRFHGIWLSEKALVIGSLVLLVLVGCFVTVWAISKPANTAQLPGYSDRLVYNAHAGGPE